MIPLALNSIAAARDAVAPGGEAAGEPIWMIGVVFVLIITVGMLVDLGLTARERLFLRRSWPLRQAAGVLLWLLAWYAAVLFLKPVWDALSGSETLWVLLHSFLFNAIGLWLVDRSLARRGLTWRAAFDWARRAWPARLGTGALYYLAAMPFIWFYSLVYQAGLRAGGYHTEWQDVALAFAGESSVFIRMLLFLLAVGLAPLFEEVMFRGILLPLVARRWGTAAAVVTVSALFAMVHFHLPSVVPLFVIAVAFSLGYLYSGSLLVPVAMHAMFNGVNLVMLAVLR
jgi:membrane protease YdiL (CAAX protease family)